MPARLLPSLLLAGALIVPLVALSTGLGSMPSARAKGARTVEAGDICGSARGATVRVSIDVPGQGDRSALVRIPRARGGRLPLLLALHGAYGSGAFMEGYSGLSRIADREGFAVVYPDAAGPRWRISAAEGESDVAFLDALLDRVLATGCLDQHRVSVVGVSNGGGMAARFACAADERLAGLVTVAGGYRSLPACSANRPLSVLEIHGTADSVVPYNGAPGTGAGAVMSWLGGWVRRDGCPSSPRTEQLTARVARLDWASCRGGAAIEHLRLAGGAHAWPGADPPDYGPDLGVSAAEEAWAFLQGRRRG